MRAEWIAQLLDFFGVEFLRELSRGPVDEMDRFGRRIMTDKYVWNQQTHRVEYISHDEGSNQKLVHHGGCSECECVALVIPMRPPLSYGHEFGFWDRHDEDLYRFAHRLNPSGFSATERYRRRRLLNEAERYALWGCRDKKRNIWDTPDGALEVNPW